MYVGSHESLRAGLAAFFMFLRNSLTDSETLAGTPEGQSETKGSEETRRKPDSYCLTLF